MAQSFHCLKSSFIYFPFSPSLLVYTKNSVPLGAILKRCYEPICPYNVLQILEKARLVLGLSLGLHHADLFYLTLETHIIIKVVSGQSQYDAP